MMLFMASFDVNILNAIKMNLLLLHLGQLSNSVLFSSLYLHANLPDLAIRESYS